MRIKKYLLGYFLVAFLSGIALAVWRTVVMVRYYDPYNNEYALEASGQLQAIGFTLFFVFVILATSALVLKNFEFKPFAVSEHQSSVFTSALLGFVFLAIGIFVSLYLNVISANREAPLFRYTQLLSYILLFFCAAYFLLNAAGRSRSESLRKMLSLCPPVWGIAFLAASYLNPAYNYKDFNHTLCNVALCALTVFFFYDVKASALGKETLAHFVFALISLSASMVYMIPTFVLLAYWELSSDLNHLFEAVLLGSIFYACTCVHILCKNVKLREKPAPKNALPKEEASI